MLAAQELGRTLAEQKIELVYGGGKVGLMGVIATSVIQAGGQVIGVIPKHLADRELIHPDVADTRIVGSMHERKALMAELGEGFIALPGGFGTLEEITEVLTWAQIGLHEKPCGLLNVNGYFESLMEFLGHAVAEEFVAMEHREMIVVDSDPRRMLEQFESYHPPTIDKVQMALEQTNCRYSDLTEE
jgi:uncharacterized protein (TIGR00730 family)